MKTTTRRWRVYTTAFVVGLSLICMTAVAGCAPQSGSSEGGSTQTAASGEWTESSDCTSCHATEASSGTDTSCLYSKHTSVACNTCHTNSGGKLATAHEDYATAKAPTKLKKTEVSSETCTTSGCHNTDELVAKTAASTDLTDANGTVVNPHSMLTDAAHKVGGTNGADITCTSCHTMHASDGGTTTGMAASAQSECKSCHHQNVYECNTCHS